MKETVIFDEENKKVSFSPMNCIYRGERRRTSMVKVVNQTSAVRMVYELPGTTPGKTVRKSKTFANIKTTLTDDVILTFGQKVLKLQAYSGKIQKQDAKEVTNE
jgi:hypothetical protein